MSMPTHRRLQLLRGRDRRTAAAERIENGVAFVAARSDDPLQQRFRLLRRIFTSRPVCISSGSVCRTKDLPTMQRRHESRSEPRTLSPVRQTVQPRREFPVAFQMHRHRYSTAVPQDQNGNRRPAARLRTTGDDIRPRDPACRQKRHGHFDPISVKSDMTAADRDPAKKKKGERSTGIREPLQRG